MMRRGGALPTFLLFPLAIAAMEVGPRTAAAGSDTAQLSVSVVVLSSCSVTGGVLDFGEYVPGQPTDLDAVGEITFSNCSGSLSFALDGGASGDVNARQMRSGDSRLSYQIYRSPNRLYVWGEGANAWEVITLQPQIDSKINVYGRIPRSQTVPDGLYTDTVNITLTF